MMTNCWLKGIYFVCLLMISMAVSAGQTAGLVKVSDAWLPARPDTMSVNAGYFTLHNHSHKTLALVGVSSPAFSSIEIHESTLTDGVFSMRRVFEVPIKSHELVEFKPSGLHLMMRNMTSKKARGDRFPVTLSFANGESVEFLMSVREDPNMKSTHLEDHHHE